MTKRLSPERIAELKRLVGIDWRQAGELWAHIEAIEAELAEAEAEAEAEIARLKAEHDEG